MTHPLNIEVDVECSPDHAFRVWTEQVDRWWPKDHNRSGDSAITVTIEPRVGGRIFERTEKGVEHDWGEVLEWSPPSRIRYLWHIAWERERATEVSVTFEPRGDATRVRVDHSGWELFGKDADVMRDRNRFGWSHVLTAFDEATR